MTQKYLIHESVELEEFIEWTKLILITGDDASLPTIPKHLRIDACRTCLTSYWVLFNSTLHTIRFDSIQSDPVDANSFHFISSFSFLYQVWQFQLPFLYHDHYPNHDNPHKSRVMAFMQQDCCNQTTFSCAAMLFEPVAHHGQR